MQHVSKRNIKPRAVGEGVVSLMSIRNGGPELNFTETLPTEMSVRIFSELDVKSLCHASVTCKHWNVIIEESDNLWRNHCLSCVCHREVDGDRSDGLSWKVGHSCTWYVQYNTGGREIHGPKYEQNLGAC